MRDSPLHIPPLQGPRQGPGSDYRVSPLPASPLKQFLPCQPCFSSHILLIPITRSWALFLANRSPFQLKNEEEEPPLAPWASCPTAKWGSKNGATAHVDAADLEGSNLLAFRGGAIWPRNTNEGEVSPPQTDYWTKKKRTI